MRVREQTAIKTHKSGFYIGVTCPGCGGPLELEKDFFVLTCEHCGSVLRIRMPDIPPAYLVKSRKNEREIRFSLDRYLKESNRPLTGSDIKFTWYYYPFWKIDGILLKLRNEIVERSVGDSASYDSSGFGGYQAAPESATRQDKMTNISLSSYSSTFRAGPDMNDIPPSLGMRSDYLRLLPYSRENIEAGFINIPVLKPWETVRMSIEKRLGLWDAMNMGDFGKNQTRLFHPQGSVIYFPYCRVQCRIAGVFRTFTIDGITGRIEIEDEDTKPFEDWQFDDGPLINFGHLSVFLHRCANCGVDLPGQQSCVYVCRNCHELSFLDDNPIITRSLKAVISPENNPRDRYFPFWALKVNASNMACLKTLFGGIYDSDRIVIPGFRTRNFEAIFRLSKRMSAAFPRFRPESIDILNSNFQPVTVGLDEALTFAEVAIGREQTGRKKNISTESTEFIPEAVELFYLPFHQESYFYVDSVLGAVTFEKNLALS